MPGPAPKRNARRTNPRPDWRELSPFTGEVPEWPIQSVTVAELALWVELWRTPQAEAWSDLGWTRVVARYARLVIQSEVDDPDRKPTAEVALLGEIRQIEDRIGLTPMSMRRLQWEIGPGGKAEPDREDNVVELFG